MDPHLSSSVLDHAQELQRKVDYGVKQCKGIEYSEVMVLYDYPEGFLRHNRSMERKTSALSFLLPFFEKQEVGSYCGIASAGMVINCTNGKTKDDSDRTRQIEIFRCAHENLFPERHPEEEVHRYGFTLDQIGDLLRLYGLEVEVRRHTEVKVLAAMLRSDALRVFRWWNERGTDKESQRTAVQFFIVNWWRDFMGHRGGHFSPLMAVDEESDSVLIFDTAKKKPFHWLSIDILARLMMRVDHASQNTRGYLLVTFHPR